MNLRRKLKDYARCKQSKKRLSVFQQQRFRRHFHLHILPCNQVFIITGFVIGFIIPKRGRLCNAEARRILSLCYFQPGGLDFFSFFGYTDFCVLEVYRSGHNGPDSKSGRVKALVGSNPTASARNMSNKDTLLLEAQPLLSRGLCFFVGRLKTFFVHSQCCLLYVLFSMFDTFFIMCHFACFDRLFYTIDTFF